MNETVTAAAPATVGNVVCGFDVLGLALEEPTDRVSARRIGEPGVRLESVTGDDGRVPRRPEENSAGAAAAALLDAVDTRSAGVSLTLEKGLPLAAGMGGSAASAVAAVVAVDALLGLEADEDVLLDAALAGERVASGAPHADNVAPALHGGILLCRLDARRRLVRLPVPEGLSVALLQPRLELETRAARELLGDRVALADAISQWGNTAALVAALYEGDLDLLADSLVDRIAEPKRAGKVPAFRAVQEAALDAGALGCSLSGAGPSVFALAASREAASRIGESMLAAFRAGSEAGADLHVSGVGLRGARVLDDPAVVERD